MNPEQARIAKYFTFKKEPHCGSRCMTIGHVAVEPKTVYPPCLEMHPVEYRNVETSRILHEFHFVHIVSGSGWYINDNGDKFAVKAGMTLPLFPNMPHAYSPNINSGWIEYWFGCDGSYPEWLLKENAFHLGRRPLDLGNDRCLLDDFRQLCLAAHSSHDNSVKSQILGGLINRVLGRIIVLQNYRAHSTAGVITGIVEKTMEFLDSRINSDIDQTELAQLTGVSYRRLSQLFKEATGFSPHQYFLDKKIKAAITLLRSGILVKDVAFRLSFDSPYYFSRLFKSKTGVSPSAYLVQKKN